MSQPTMIFTDVDYNRQGKQVDWLNLPHSVTRSAYGSISIPVAVVNNGEGPTVFLMAGNHGDEYEGQIVLAKLIRELEPAHVRGRVIILPAANLPAAMDGARVSPIDQGNLNRAFPGDPHGTPTFAIAHYIDSILYPMADYHHDLHSGGSSLKYMPFCSMRKSGDAALDARSLAALQAFDAPLSMVWAYNPENRLAGAAAARRGLVSLGGEFGGGGNVDRSSLAMLERGVRNFLQFSGVMADTQPLPAPRGTRLVEVNSRDHYVYATESGLLEPLVDLGAEVRQGDLAGQIHFVDNPARAPVPCHFRRAGMVVCQRHFGRVQRGDCVAHLATDVH
ncbi:MAG: succinylglutamate desuccinylase/aspartoacylase family protein [Rhodoferax sp.]|jgi:predicted deacylase|nr:succinylglutamate desuccinylase/aspartoacylase family protein [Rhodoferax sp.]